MAQLLGKGDLKEKLEVEKYIQRKYSFVIKSINALLDEDTHKDYQKSRNYIFALNLLADIENICSKTLIIEKSQISTSEKSAELNSSDIQNQALNYYKNEDAEDVIF